MKINNIPETLEELKNKNQYRSVRNCRMIDSTHCIDMQGKEYIVFSSNNYLGLAHDPRVICAAENCCKYGTGSTGSRLTSGGGFELHELEQRIAEFKKTESALVFNTGYMTNLGVLYALCGSEDIIFSDEYNHASIIDGCRISRCRVVVYKHNNMDHLKKLLEETQIDSKGQRFIVTDGVFSMDGDIALLPELIELKKEFNACLIVDDAHAVGVIGKHGAGTADHYGITEKNAIDIQIGTLSKALGSEGGYAAASSSIIEYIKNKSRPFIFSTSLSPSTAKAADTALSILQEEASLLLDKLNKNTKYMRSLLSKTSFNVVDGITPIIPILIGDEKLALSYDQYCSQNQILLCAIRPPSVPEGTARLRLTVTAAHSFEDIEKAYEVLRKCTEIKQKQYL